MRKKFVGSILSLALCMVFVGTANAGAIINEFHYDNDGGDVNEFIEVVLDGGTLPADVTVTLYNGSGGTSYNTLALSTFTSHGVLGDGRDYYSLVLPPNGLQNGAPDGIAIDISSTLSEFLSYEGTFAATDGVAIGITSTDVGVSEPGDAPAGSALQRIDFGSTWCYSPGTSTMGAINDCGLPTGVCCDTTSTPNSCDDGVLEAECIAPGVWTLDGTCEADCAWLGACCDPDDNWSCSITTQAACTSPTAYWVGGGTCEEDCVAPTGSCCNETTYACDEDMTEFDCTTTYPGRVWTQGGTCLSCAPPVSGLIINEVDADTPGDDAAEFIELFDGGDGTTSLDGYVIVLFNGSSDLSYLAIDLDGYATDANGYFVIGSTGMAVADIQVDPGTWGWLQNGADAVALYTGDDTDFPNDTAVTTTNLVDALVYDTNDGDDAELLVLLNASEPQINEDGGGDKDNESMQRCLNGTGGARNTSTYGTYAPTPGSENCVTPTGSCCDETTWTCWPDLTEDDCTTLHAGAVWTVAGDCADCVAPIGSCCDETTWTCWPDLTEDDCTTLHPGAVWTEDGDCANCIDIPDGLIINEVDANTPGIDTLEFIELYNDSAAPISLSGLVLVLYNGSNDSSYFAVELGTGSIPADGYFLIGNTAIGPDIIIDDDTLQNGADAVAIYVGSEGDFPNGTAVTTENLIDAVVYDTNDDDDAELLVLTPGQPQINEDENGDDDNESIRRCPNGSGGALVTSTYYAGTPTPAGDNNCLPPDGACCNGTTCTVTTEADCTGDWLGANTTCSPVNPCECSDIDTARALEVGQPVFLCNVTISNVITTSGSTNNKSIHLQDDSGSPRGLTVYAANADVDAIFAIAGLGDRINVRGYIGEYASLLQLASPLTDPTYVDSPGVPAATVITPADLADGSTYAEEIESVRVKLECVQFMVSGTFSSGVDYWVTDGTDQAKVRLPAAVIDLVGSPIPDGPVDITGFVAQYDWGAGDAGYQVYLMDSADLVASTACTDPLGACCYETGTCVLTSDAICTATGGVSWEGAGTTCEPINPCIAATGACCVDQVCVATNEESECDLLDGTWYIYEDCGSFTCPGPIEVVINEIRIDEPSTDNSEYFELKGAEGTSLSGLTYIVIGDGGGVSGTIEAVVDLTGQTMPAGGLFLAAEGTFALTGIPDFTTVLDFENGDNVTHLLVQGFTGSLGQDLDTDDDCVLDIKPWGFLIDGVALIENDESPPAGTECHYASEAGVEGVGPAGSFVPAHVYRCDGEGNPNWLMGEYDPAMGTDTPRAANPCSGPATCNTCPGDLDGNETVHFDDLADFVTALLSDDPHPCANMNPPADPGNPQPGEDELVNGEDIQPFINAILANGGEGTPCFSLPGQHDIEVCYEAPGTPECPQYYCMYQEYHNWSGEEVDPIPAGYPRCEVDAAGQGFLPFGQGVCVSCPTTGGGTCDGVQGGTDPAEVVIFHWVDYDGAGSECWFTGKLIFQDCSDSSVEECPEDFQFIEIGS